MQSTDSITGIVVEPTQLIATVSINEITHQWQHLKDSQKAAILSELKLVQAAFDFGVTLRRAESQMGQDRLLQELEEQGIEEHTAKQVMKIAKDNPGGITQIAGDEKKLKQYAEQLTFPSTDKPKEVTIDKGLPPWKVTDKGLQLNANPSEWHRYGQSYSVESFCQRFEGVLRIFVEIGKAKLISG